MAHKYLNKIGIKSTETCVFNTEEKEKSPRQKHFNKMRKKHGFDPRETWALDFTLATWIYEHFMYYKKYAAIDLTFHKFMIPAWDNENNEISNETIEVTQEEAINIVLDNIKFYLVNEEISMDEVTYKKYEYALRVISIIIPAMWW